MSEARSLQSMMGKRVLSGDGLVLGRVFSAHAQREGGAIRITHLLVGKAEWLELLWPHHAVRRLFTRHPPLALPWAAVASWDENRCIRLKDYWTRQLCLALSTVREPNTPPHPEHPSHPA
jgi:hypothetical protein